MTNKIDYKYNEDRLLQEIADYIDGTYGQHYSRDKFQATEFIFDGGHGTGFCIGNVLKYAQRYGKKGNPDDWRKDLMKVIHYAILQLYVHDEEWTNPVWGGFNSVDVQAEGFNSVDGQAEEEVKPEPARDKTKEEIVYELRRDLEMAEKEFAYDQAIKKQNAYYDEEVEYMRAWDDQINRVRGY